jgi:hypothetical protein
MGTPIWSTFCCRRNVEMATSLHQEIDWMADARASEAGYSQAGYMDAADYGMHLLAGDEFDSDEDFLEEVLFADAEEDENEDWDYEAFRTGGNARLAAVRGRIFAHG